MITPQSRVDQGPTTTPDAIRAELAHYGSPLTNYAQHIYDLGVQYNVDPAFFMGTVFGENWYGTYPGNGAYDPATGYGTFNWSSITNALYGGSPVAGTRWGQYPNPQAGVEAFFRLLTAEYYPNGQRTLASIWWGVGGSCSPCVDGAHAYGPCSDNHGNCSSLDTVLTVMNRIQAGGYVPPPPPPPPDPGDGGPFSCPAGTIYDQLSGACMGASAASDVSLPLILAGAGLVVVAGLIVTGVLP